ncbi:hypothetical protein EXW62_24105 [Bacillus mycoides]|nr:hypothetical protein EXW62_24105 [Bacillus mycoides]
MKATLKLEDTLPAFLFAILSVHTPVSTFRNISAIFQIYRPFLHLYRRFDTVYRFTDILRHPKSTTYPIPQATYYRTPRLKR